MKPDFQRFRTAITREALPDRVPNAEVGIDIEMMDAFVGSPINDLGSYVTFFEQAGYDFVLLQVRGQPLPDSSQPLIRQRRIGSAKRTSSLGTFGSGAVIDQQSFDAYPWIGRRDVVYGDVDDVKRYLPDGMMVIVNHGPLFSGMWRIMGLEAFAEACAANTPLIRAIAEKMGELSVAIVEEVLQREWVGALWLGDDIGFGSGLMVSPEFLRDYVFPYYRRIGDLCRRHRKPFLYHSDGRIDDVIGDLIGAGIHALHPNEPACCDIVERKRVWGDRVAVIGNIDVDLLTRGTPGQITRAARRLIESVGPSGGFALGSGNSVTKHVPIANYRAMLEAVRVYGGIY